MAVFQGIFLLVSGVLVLLIDHRSLSEGWLPFGPSLSNGLNGRVEVWRTQQPFGYWLLFLIYGIFGLWMFFFGLALLVGHAHPLPVR